jgi:hypothetical protein
MYLAMVLGKKAASAEFFCLWCVCPKTAINSETVYPALLSYNEANEGSKDKSLFDFLKPHMVIVDLLHLLLRVSDQVCCAFNDHNKFIVCFICSSKRVFLRTSNDTMPRLEIAPHAKHHVVSYVRILVTKTYTVAL